MTRDELVEFLRENLTLDSVTKSEYTGCGEGPMYRDYTTIKLMLGSECIGEVSVNG